MDETEEKKIPSPDEKTEDFSLPDDTKTIDSPAIQEPSMIDLGALVRDAESIAQKAEEHRIKLTESTMEERKAFERHRRGREDESHTIAKQTKRFARRTIRKSKKASVVGLAWGIENADGITGSLSYAAISMAVVCLWEGRLLAGVLLAIVGFLLIIIKHQIPQRDGNIIDFLRKPAPEIKQIVKQKLIDLSRSITG